MMKQKQNSPIPFYKQALMIYAGVNGYLDVIAVSNVASFEQSLYDKMDTTYKGLAEAIEKEKQLTDDIEKKMKEVINSVVEEYKN